MACAEEVTESLRVFPGGVQDARVAQRRGSVAGATWTPLLLGRSPLVAA